MKLFYLPLFITGTLLTLCQPAQAQVRKYSNEYMNIGVGARALGMANAQVSTVEDVTSGYWNPAGLMGVKGNVSLAAMHAEYFAGIAKYDYAGFATPIDSVSTLGLSLIRFGVDDIPNTIDLIDAQGNVNYDRISSFSAADYALMFSYARKMGIPHLRLGGNAKIIHRTAGDFVRAWGFGFDAGMQYRYNDWMFGAMARDITSTFTAWTFNLSDRMEEVFELTGNEIPQNGLEIALPRLILATARKVDIKEKFSVLAAMDMDFTFDGMRNVLIRSKAMSIDPHLGIELGYMDFIFLRGGIGNVQQIKAEVGDHMVTVFQPNMGVGVRLKNLTIDYALTNIGDQSVALYSNIFSLRLDLYKKGE